MKSNRKKFSCHFGEGDIIIDNFILNPVHMLPKDKWQPKQEIDFYMDDSVNIYLLRIINSDENTVTLVNGNDIRYIIVCIKVENTFDILREIIQRLKDFPYSKKISKKQESYSFMR